MLFLEGEGIKVIIIQKGDTKILEQQVPGKGETIDFLLVDKDEKEEFLKSNVGIGLIPCVAQDGKIIFY